MFLSFYGGDMVNIGTICSREVVVCRRETSALDAARLIRNHHVGDLVVVDGQEDKPNAVGIVTDRDIIVSIVAKEVDPATVFVGDIMTAAPVTAFDWEDLWPVIRRMRMNAVRRMPVVNDANELFGIVTLDDLLAAAAALLTELAQVSGRERSFEEKARR
jgi:CBS domain-containing protein